MQDKTITQLKMHNKNYSWLMVLVIIFPYLLIFQGLDFSDVGYSLTNHQQIFIEPSSIQYAMNLWLTNILGGCWVWLFENLGVFGVKLGGALVISLTTFITYTILKNFLEKKHLLIGLLLAEIVAFSRSIIIIHYNNLTSLFFILSVFFLYNGILHKKNNFIFFAGFTLGLNIFVRFPNILGIILIVTIFFYGYLKKNNLSTQIKQALILLFGWIISILIVFIIMKLLGHYELFLNSLKNLFGMALDSSSSHAGEYLLRRLYTDHLSVIKYSIRPIVIAILISKIFCKVNRYLRDFALLLFSIVIVFYYFYDYIRMSYIFALVGIMYIVLLISIISFERNNIDIRLISLIALIVLFITPLGSGNGIHNAQYGMWLAFPLLVSFNSQLREPTLNINLKFLINQSEIVFIGKILLIFFLSFALIFSYRYTYRDTSRRINMRYQVNHPKLKLVYTTKERAEVVEELLNEISKYIQKGDYLLCYEMTSMVHFLTQTKPYLYNSWPMLYQPMQFKEAVQRAINEKKELPVIVRAKRNTDSLEWPNSRTGLRISSQYIENRKIMEYFIQVYHYKLIWENNFFQILSAN